MAKNIAKKTVKKTSSKKVIAAKSNVVKANPVISQSSNKGFAAVANNLLNSNLALLLIFALIFILGFAIGSLYRENQILRSQNYFPSAADSGSGAVPQSEVDLSAIPAISDSDHLRGNTQSKVSVVVYSDFECPVCHNFHPILSEVMEKYSGKINWTIRHFPLSFHPNAQKLAEASECVAKYGSNQAFWQFADTVFAEMTAGTIYADSSRTTVSDEKILSLAQAAGANRQQVASCLANGEAKEKVSQDFNAARQAGVNGTPNIVILAGDKGEVIPGMVPAEQLSTTLEKYL